MKSSPLSIPSSPSAPLAYLFRSSTQYQSRCIWAAVCSALNKLFDIAPEILIGIAIDIVVQKRPSFLANWGFDSSFAQLVALAILTFIIWALESCFEYLFSLAWRQLAQMVQHDLRIKAYDHLQKLDMKTIEGKSTGNLVNIINDDINQLERFLDQGANAVIQLVTSTVLIVGLFFYISPIVAIWAMAPIPVILGGAFYFQKRIEPLYRAVRAEAAHLGARLSANIIGIATIKTQTAEAFEMQSITNLSMSYLKANKTAIGVSSAFVPLIRIAILSGFIATLILGGDLALKGELAVGSFGILVFLTQRLLWPMTRVAETADLYQRARASTERVLGLLNEPIPVVTGPAQLTPKTIKGDVKFIDVNFSYRVNVPVLSKFNLQIDAGSSIGLVGTTGSGKSTVARLLLGLSVPDSGVITLEGQPLNRFEIKHLRKLIGYVSQDIYLIDGSIEDNIRYGSFAATIDEVIAAARASDAHEFIVKLPDGYKTIIGERGRALSGGQRQRLAIARALIKNPPIMILDEATSAVDYESERLIQRALERIAIDRTMIVIAHRLTTLKRVDRIYVLDEGRIIESGSHNELMRQKGHYYALWEAQGP